MVKGKEKESLHGEEQARSEEIHKEEQIFPRKQWERLSK
jgi:hypothetical protein